MPSYENGAIVPFKSQERSELGVLTDHEPAKSLFGDWCLLIWPNGRRFHPGTTSPVSRTEIATYSGSVGDAEGRRTRPFTPQVQKHGVRFHVLAAPACKANSTRRLRVVYWLRGSGVGVAGITPGRCPSLFIVFVNGLQIGMYIDWANGLVLPNCVQS